MTREDLVGTWKFQGFTLTGRDWGAAGGRHCANIAPRAREIPEDDGRAGKDQGTPQVGGNSRG
jgi:hypothetical protein